MMSMGDSAPSFGMQPIKLAGGSRSREPRHARGEDEPRRERRDYLTARTIKVAVEQGRRHADVAQGRERLIMDKVGPSGHLVVVVEIHAEAGTVITAFAMRRVPQAWRRL